MEAVAEVPPVSHPQGMDTAWVNAARQGDPQGFRHLYQRHQARVRVILHSLCGSEALDDLVQEVFIRAWKGLPRFRQDAQFSTWLYRIAWNVGTDQRRTYGRQRTRQQAWEHSHRTEHLDPDVLHIHYQSVVQAGLDHLSPQHRLVLVLHDLEEWPQKDIAATLGIPVGTVKSRLFHARSSLRRFLEQAGIHP
ncbi:MAG: sigma-70 family RNA polymerase sigma factor [Synechococcales cyanobacterium]